MSDEDWLDELLVADDTSARGWARKATGVKRDQAMYGVPRFGQFNCKAPIEEWRAIRAHIRTQHTSISMWMRHALATKYETEGGNPDLIPTLKAGGRDRPRRR